ARAFAVSRLKWLLPRRTLRGIGLISSNDSLHERMTNDVAVVEMNKRYTFHAGNHVACFNQTGHLSDGKIYLRYVASNHSLTAVSDSSEKHFHLFRSRIL